MLPLAQADDEGASSFLYTLYNEQVILLATVVAAVAALPPLIEFLVDRRKRHERIELSLDDVRVETLQPRLAGLDALLADIADLVDRAREPARYPGLTVGNELLLLGPNLTGKKALAQTIAVHARLERLITVYNPRDTDALAKAKTLVRRRYRGDKLMLLLPRIDLVFEKEDDELHAELEALVETVSEQPNVLVVGTAVRLAPDGPLDNLFGIKVLLPGTQTSDEDVRAVPDDLRPVLADVARYYLQTAARAGFALDGLTEAEAVDRLLAQVGNPAEVEDVVSVAQTSALYRRNSGHAATLTITPAILDAALGRVVVGAVG